MRPAESVASSAVKTAFDTKAAMIGKRPLNIARLHLYVVVVLIRNYLSFIFPLLMYCYSGSNRDRDHRPFNCQVSPKHANPGIHRP